MLEGQVEQIREGISEFLLDRLRATGEAFWEALTSEQKVRMIQAVQDIPTLGFESILDPDQRKSMGNDLKAVIWTLGTDISTAMLREHRTVDDPVVRAMFEIVLTTMQDKKGDPDAL